MKTSMDKIIRSAFYEMGVKAVEKKGEEDEVTFFCSYRNVNIEIISYNTRYRIKYFYSDLERVSEENLPNVLKFFSYVNGYGQSNGLIFNVILFDNDNQIIAGIRKGIYSGTKISSDLETHFLDSKYFKYWKEEFKHIFSYETNNVVQIYPYILKVLRDKENPRDVWLKSMNRPRKVRSIFDQTLRVEDFRV